MKKNNEKSTFENYMTYKIYIGIAAFILFIILSIIGAFK